MINQTFSSIMGVVHTFPEEKPIVIREVRSGSYAIGPYWLSKTFVDLPMNFFFPLVFAISIFWLSGLDIGMMDNE
jgi:hypothetical protein